MTVTTRIFRVEGGPLAEAIKTVSAERERIGATYAAFGEVIGADQVHTWPWTGRFAGCTFAAGKEPPLRSWRKSHKMWVPRKNTPDGETVWQSAQALPPVPAIQTVLEPHGLTVHKAIFGDKPAYVEGFGHVGIYYVHVPWPTISQELIDLEYAVGGDIAADIKFVAEWKPPLDWVEVNPFQKLLEWTELDRA